jgi:arylformamidase
MLTATDSDYLIDGSDPVTQQIVARRKADSIVIRAGANAELDIVYGAHPRARFDLFWPKDAPRAVLIFIHGGWWKSGSKDDRAFIAPAWTDKGVAVATINYPLAPEASLPEITTHVTTAIDAICAHIHGRTQKTVPYVITGNSAGGHLTAFCASAGKQAHQGRLIGACAMSGLYDLAPIATVFPNEWMRLTQDDIATLSPIRLAPSEGVDYLLLVGANEPPGFEAQQRIFADYLASKAISYTTETVSGHGHLSIIDNLIDPSSTAFRWISARMDAL